MSRYGLVSVGVGGGARRSRQQMEQSAFRSRGERSRGSGGGGRADEGWVLEIERKAPREHLFRSTKCDP